MCYTPLSRISTEVAFGANLKDSLTVYPQDNECGKQLYFWCVVGIIIFIIIVVVDFTNSGVAIQSWLSNVTLSHQNICYLIH